MFSLVAECGNYYVTTRHFSYPKFSLDVFHSIRYSLCFEQEREIIFILSIQLKNNDS